MATALLRLQQRWTHRRPEEQETVLPSWAESELWGGNGSACLRVTVSAAVMSPTDGVGGLEDFLVLFGVVDLR